MAKRKNDSVRVSRGVRNVLADLGIKNAAKLSTKVRLAVAINCELAVRDLSQVDAAALLGINQPKVSALRNFKVEGFSVEKLLTILTALGSDIEIVVRPRKRVGKSGGRISVTPFAKRRAGLKGDFRRRQL
jgi:predicted XRE-type DNA-binding protein